MKANYKIAIALLSGLTIGGAAIQGLHAQSKPPDYVITETTVTDPDGFKEFASKVPGTMQEFGGKYLARGGKVIGLEGDAPQRVIVTAFDSMEKAQAWRNSAAWKAIEPLRAKSTKVHSAYIVEGVTQ